MTDPAILRAKANALRGEQRMVEAHALYAQGAALWPDDRGFVFGRAQSAFEIGLPAAAHFAAALRLIPDEPELIRNQAAALAAEGGEEAACALLSQTLAQNPGWLDGHKALATLRWTRGEQVRFAESYAQACVAEPRNVALWLAWFSALALAKDWPGATAVLDAAQKHLGADAPGVLASRLYLACEGGVGDADNWLARTAKIEGDATQLCRIRHALRCGRPEAAEKMAQPLTSRGSAPLFWPYLSLAWRLQGDDRAVWLDRPDDLIASIDVGLSAFELTELAEVLRSLHTLARPYIEQSVRGGTQTDRSVILRHEPILQRTRARWIEALADHVSALPAHEEGHPLLGLPRTPLRIEGSWSVRLFAQGHNVPHTHPMGWLSTAFYISLPAAQAMGEAPAGHIAFGTPPDDLGLDLPAYRHIAPVAGQCAVFPSTMWHGTVPFDDGERLVMALDISRPQGERA